MEEDKTKVRARGSVIVYISSPLSQPLRMDGTESYVSNLDVTRRNELIEASNERVSDAHRPVKAFFFSLIDQFTVQNIQSPRLSDGRI